MNKTINLQEYAASVPEDVRKELDWSFAIADRLEAILREKQLSHKDFAKRMGKTEAEVSRWVSGTHNFTLRTIARISSALGTDLIRV